MATLSSHLLSSVDGTHAGNVPVTIVRIAPDGSRATLRETATDEGGRLQEEVSLNDQVADTQYEMVIATGKWFAAQNLPHPGPQIVSDVVIRFAMPDPDSRYHIPVIIGPNGYSTWWSS